MKVIHALLSTLFQLTIKVRLAGEISMERRMVEKAEYPKRLFGHTDPMPLLPPTRKLQLDVGGPYHHTGHGPYWEVRSHDEASVNFSIPTRCPSDVRFVVDRALPRLDLERDSPAF